jgi:flagellar basal-body rod protein FlgG
MAITALHSAASGMKAMDTQLDIIANNLANSSTTGFKAQRANFEDLFYEARRQPGSLNSLGQRTSSGLFVGLGTRLSNTQFDMTNGSPEQTSSETDIAISGPGFFKVKTFDSIGKGEAYTRDGNFHRNEQGQLVLGTSDGPLLDPTITISQDATEVTITSDGVVSEMVNGATSEIGQIQLYRFANPQGMRLEGGNLLTETEASGPPIAGNPRDVGFGGLIQKALETSNVDPVKELVSMIRAQRSFELNSQSIQASNENLQVVSRLR